MNIADLGKTKYEGSNTATGKAYHSFDGFEGCSHRGDVAPRVDLILKNMHVKGLRGVDFGCNVGGITLGLATQKARMAGYDYDHQSIEIAREYSQKLNVPAEFVVADITLDCIKEAIKKTDFVIWFSQWMWFVKHHGITDGLEALFQIGKKNIKLFFETSCGDGQAGPEMRQHGITQERIEQILKDCFALVRKFDCVDGWKNRPIFYCSRGLPFEYRGQKTNTVERIGFDRVRKTQPEANCLRAVSALKKLKGNPHFPQLFYHDETNIEISFCGSGEEKIPADYEKQSNEILTALKSAEIIHNDICPQNILIHHGIIKLIDFSWATAPGDSTEGFPRGLGRDCKIDNDFIGTNSDEYGLRKSIEKMRKHRG